MTLPLIDAGFDKIPDFAAFPTIKSVASGQWSDPSIWDQGRVPAAADVVMVQATHDVVLSSAGVARVIGVHGCLDSSAALALETAFVYDDGCLEFTAGELTFIDSPLDAVDDPNQWSHGLIVLGEFKAHGIDIGKTWVRLAVEPRVGDVVLILQDPVGWLAGQKIVLPDTRQLTGPERTSSAPQWETLAIHQISADGRILYLSSPCRFNHFGARDGSGTTVDFWPIVANLSRSVILRSANPGGVRGHTLYTGRANIEVKYVHFDSLGRTRNDLPTGPTNQIARYPAHFHHVHGPVTPQANGRQFTFHGNLVTCSLEPTPYKWGITIHDSHYGEVSNNVVYNRAGAGIVCEIGSETENLIADNFVMRIDGTGTRNSGGREGAGFWFRGVNNRVKNNVACNIRSTRSPDSYAYLIDMKYAGNQVFPVGQGLDPMVPGNTVVKDVSIVPILEFSGNECFGSLNALTYWWIGSNGSNSLPGARQSTIRDMKAWHCHNMFLSAYQSAFLAINGFVIRGDFAKLGAMFTRGLYFGDYFQHHPIIQNADIQGVNQGIQPTTSASGELLFQDSYLCCKVNVAVSHLWTSASTPSNVTPRVVRLSNIQFAAPPGLPLVAISMDWPATLANGTFTLIQKDQVFVENYNSRVGDNFQVFRDEQEADYLIPRTIKRADGSIRVLACPEAGLTNQQSLARYGVAVGGEVVPAGAVTRIGINGLVTMTT